MNEELERLESLERHGMLTQAEDQNALEALRAKSREKPAKKAPAKKATTKKAVPAKKTPAKKATNATKRG